jgi:hypothetical protein
MIEEKTKEERVRESITLLKKLPAAGIPTSHEVYVHINEQLSKWVKLGLPSSEEIDLGTHVANLSLPIVKDDTISFHLKAKK